MPKILFVCTGNTCRSPMAEALLSDIVRARAARPNLWDVSSAGTDALDGTPIAAHARAILHEQYGLDAGAHRSRPVSAALLERQDVILVMEERHKRRVEQIAPEVKARLYTLREYADKGSPGDVGDPFGGTEDEYREVAKELRRLLEQAWPRLRLLDE